MVKQCHTSPLNVFCTPKIFQLVLMHELGRHEPVEAWEENIHSLLKPYPYANLPLSDAISDGETRAMRRLSEQRVRYQRPMIHGCGVGEPLTYVVSPVGFCGLQHFHDRFFSFHLERGNDGGKEK